MTNIEKEEEYDLFEAAVDYAREKVYPKDCTINQKRIIRTKLLLSEEWRSVFQEG